jgi:hypothetical protein
MKVVYPSDRSVSIWVGRFVFEDDLDTAIDGEVEPLLKLKSPLASIAEIAYEEHPVDVSKLLEGFSGWRSFVEAAASAARLKQVVDANAALVCYHLRCVDAPDSWGSLTFLGSFEGSDIG